MLEIYIDGVLINVENYLGLRQKWIMFDKEFKLGTCVSRSFTLTLPKSVFNPDSQTAKIRYNSLDYAYLVIDGYR